MKQTLAWLMGMGCVGAMLVFVLVGGREQHMPVTVEPAKEDTTAQPQAPTEPRVSDRRSEVARPSAQTAVQVGEEQIRPEKIAYTFTKEAEWREFLSLWQKRQDLLLRGEVLEWYWNKEQARMAKLVEKLINDYKVDPMKDYVLDRQRRVLLDRKSQPPPNQTPGNP